MSTGDTAECLGVDDATGPSAISHGFLKAMLGTLALGGKGLSIAEAKTPTLEEKKKAHKCLATEKSSQCLHKTCK